MAEHAVCGCWNRARHSIFYIASSIGVLSVWDLLVSLEEPILAVKLCEDKLTAVTSHEMGSLIAVGNTAGNVYLMELSEALYSFDKNDRNELTSVSLPSIGSQSFHKFILRENDIWESYKQHAVDKY